MTAGGAKTRALSRRDTEKVERQISLLQVLLFSRTPITRSQIYERVELYRERHEYNESFAKLFERDKADVRALGFQIQTDADHTPATAGYWIDSESARLPDLTLPPEQQHALIAAAHAYATIVPVSAQSALRKLDSAAQLSHSTHQPGFFQHDGGVSQDLDAAQQLFIAIEERRVVRFRYRRARELSFQVRTVEPWKLAQYQGQWYVHGFDQGRQDSRVFRLSRILGTVRLLGTSQAFEAPSAEQLAQLDLHVPQSEDELQITVRTEPGTALFLRELAGVDPAGAQFDLPTCRPEAALALLVGHGSEVEVRAPDWARTQWLQWLEQIVARSVDPHVIAAEPPVKIPRQRATQPESAQDRVNQLLTLVPWLQQHHPVSVSEAAAHFAVSEEQLLALIEQAMLTGVGWHAEELIDIAVTDDIITVLQAQQLERPLRFTYPEVFTLLIGLDQLESYPGGTDSLDISGARHALRNLLGLADVATTAVRPLSAGGALTSETLTGSAAISDRQENIALVQQAMTPPHRDIQFHYLNRDRDESQRRKVIPLRLRFGAPEVLLEAWCLQNQDIRRFRLDRMKDVTMGSFSEAALVTQAYSRLAQQPSWEQTLTQNLTCVLEASAEYLLEDIRLTSLSVGEEQALVVNIPYEDERWAQRTVAQLAPALRWLNKPDLLMAAAEQARQTLTAVTQIPDEVQ